MIAEIIAEIPHSEESYLLELKKSVRSAKEDVKVGKTVKHHDIIEEIRKDLLQNLTN